VVDTLIDWSLGIHFAIFLGAISFYKFVVADIAKDIIKNGKNISKKIEVRIFSELSNTLKPLFEEEKDKAIAVINLWLEGAGEYNERLVDLQGTEQYKNSIFDFINSNVNSIADFRYLMLSIDKCLFWKRYLRWSNYILIALDLIAIIIEVVFKIFNVCNDNKMVVMLLLAFAFILIINCVWSLWPLHIHQDRIEKYEKNYA